MHEGIWAWIMVLVLHYWSGLTQGMPFISANCRDDIRLPCSVSNQDTLVLQNVQPFDSGIYQCFLAADVGQKDRESFVLLTVSECVTVSPTWTTSGGVCIQNVVEVSILWSLVGFSLFSLCKIIFCTIIVTVCKKQRGSEARRRSGKLRNDSCKHRDKRHL
ncbi:uncharacterized protein LOC108265860 isoform X3 [Ictalurus punctatus]|uniref:Uncharacterized protein LOC108265860 isoform X3 n=1 Tax=Ictalurus punctatus TaxID=7998 RepID=A0A2D0R0R4_ICTPU|nr:uncharacterized protein LOC108265860 isoform X3 [Ictalurus punctatus]